MFIGDCCPDFKTACPNLIKYPDKRETVCSGFNPSSTIDGKPMVGVQIVVGCPLGSEEKMKTSCEAASGNADQVLVGC